MSTLSTLSTGKSSASDPTASEREAKCGCDIDIRIDARGDVNIYNCATPVGTGPTAPPDQPACFPPSGACLLVVPGAKHKLSRDHKLAMPDDLW